jgi:hypothetical protein
MARAFVIVPGALMADFGDCFFENGEMYRRDLRSDAGLALAQDGIERILSEDMLSV